MNMTHKLFEVFLGFVKACGIGYVDVWGQHLGSLMTTTIVLMCGGNNQ